MRKSILILLLACLSFLYLASCDSGDGNGEGEFTVFDVFINPDLSGCNLNVTPHVPRNELKLSLLVRGKNISGTGELLAFGNIGEAEKLNGQTENNNFFLNPFEASVASDPPTNESTEPDSITFSFDDFVGEFVYDDMDGLIHGIEGIFSASLTVVEEGESTFCEEITGEISGIARKPEGCVSRREIPTLECPAEGFVNQCNQNDFYFCFGFCEPFNGGTICVDFGFNASECRIIDCVTLSCPSVGTIHLEEEGGFMFGSGDHILHCG